jgi:type IV pilus assembly protein PilB
MPDLNNKLFALNSEQEERHTKEYADRLKLPYVSLIGYPFAPDVLETIPFVEAIKYKIIPFLKIGTSVRVGVVEPESPPVKQYLEALGKPADLKFAISVISSTSFLFGLQTYETQSQKKLESKDKIGVEEQSTLADKINSLADVAKTAANVSVTKTFDVIMIGAVKVGASDVHLEPGEQQFKVRYRIDGILQDAVTLPASSYKGLLSRVKFLSKLKMDKTGEPQDGRFSITIDNKRVDLRVATLPSAYGESVVIRLLGQDSAMQHLDSLGFREEALTIIRQAMSKPHGMILNTGPTGSGKSTTLYAILLEIRKPGVKIITLEDPIEYRIEGVEQSQIDPEGSYTFADGLRGALRADPDVIMVGEIRDTETAQIAVQAALTGHLLLSTIHANSAPAVFPRLIDIGVKPFLLAGSINLVMAQRLIRLNCSECIESYTPTEPIWQEIKHSLLPVMSRLEPEVQQALSGPMILKRGKGCTKCNQSGFVSRQAIIEVMKPGPEIEELVARQATLSEFNQLAIKNGMITMEQDGLIKVLQGRTTVEEVWRVTKE